MNVSGASAAPGLASLPSWREEDVYAGEGIAKVRAAAARYRLAEPADEVLGTSEVHEVEAVVRLHKQQRIADPFGLPRDRAPFSASPER